MYIHIILNTYYCQLNFETIVYTRKSAIYPYNQTNSSAYPAIFPASECADVLLRLSHKWKRSYNRCNPLQIFSVPFLYSVCQPFTVKCGNIRAHAGLDNHVFTCTVLFSCISKIINPKNLQITDKLDTLRIRPFTLAVYCHGKLPAS